LAKVGWGLDFDGDNDYVAISDDDSLDMGDNNFTVSAWIYSETYPSTTKFLGKGGNTGWRWTRSSGDYLIFEAYDGADWNAFTSSLPLTTNTWMHIVTVIDRNNDEAKFYLDGVWKSTEDISSISSLSFSNSNQFQIGRDPWGTQYHDGFIDEVKIYGYARSADEVKMDYNQGAVSFR